MSGNYQRLSGNPADRKHFNIQARSDAKPPQLKTCKRSDKQECQVIISGSQEIRLTQNTATCTRQTTPIPAAQILPTPRQSKIEQMSTVIRKSFSRKHSNMHARSDAKPPQHKTCKRSDKQEYHVIIGGGQEVIRSANTSTCTRQTTPIPAAQILPTPRQSKIEQMSTVIRKSFSRKHSNIQARSDAKPRNTKPENAVTNKNVR